jgi:hypothetical protein
VRHTAYRLLEDFKTGSAEEARELFDIPMLGNNQEISPLQDVRNYDMELFAGF